MKNFKKMIAATTLTAVMSLSTFAHTGLLVSDRSVNNSTPTVCDTKGPDQGILLSDLIEGIIVFGLTSGGIIVFGKGTPAPCATK